MLYGERIGVVLGATIVVAFSFGGLLANAEEPTQPLLQTANIVAGPELGFASDMRSVDQIIPIDSEFTLEVSAGTMVDGGVCPVPLAFDVVNAGAQQVQAFGFGVYDMSHQVQRGQFTSLEPGESASAQVHLPLANGPHRLKVILDDMDQVTEADEANNVVILRLIVRGCGFDSMES